MVAAGSGVRLGADRPKALVELDGQSLLSRSCRAMAAGGVTHLVVVAPATDLDTCRLQAATAGLPLLVVAGGARRQDSVRLGLQAIQIWDEVVSADPSHTVRIALVHDAARPLVPADVVAEVITAVRQGAPVVAPAIAVADSIRRQLGDDSEVVNRDDLRAVQTPQGFDLQTLIAAHQALVADQVEVTDDAAACERRGHPVRLVAGSTDSLKITTAIDLVVATALLQREG